MYLISVKYKKPLTYLIIFLLIIQGHLALPQTTFSGSGTKLYTGSGTSIFFGTDVEVHGEVSNEGKLVFESDADLGNNTEVGSLSFVGSVDQTLSGDSLVIDNLELNKNEALSIVSDWTVVLDEFNSENGIFISDETNLLLQGIATSNGAGFVEGPILGLSRGQDLVFPVGVNGIRNYITISGVANNSIIQVECIQPGTETLLPNDEMIGLADEMIWQVSLSRGEAHETQFTGDFSGIDLQNLVNANSINAFEYDPSLAVLAPGDSIYRTLESSQITNTDEISFGIISSTQNVFISDEPTYIGVATIPVQVAPTFYIPNSFSPTATLEDNRIFRPYFTGASVSSINFRVFDAFNNVIYQAFESGNDIDIGPVAWDGTINGGLEAPKGVYYYSVLLTANGIRYEKVGSVLLVK